MKQLLFLVLILVPNGLMAQNEPDFEALQKQWLGLASEASKLLWSSYHAYTFPEEIAVDKAMEYQHIRTFRHDDGRYLTVGLLSSGIEFKIITTAWRLSDEGWKKEMDLLLNNVEDTNRNTGFVPQLMVERRKWVGLANQHDPETHIAESYIEGATYLSGGRESLGRQAIAVRYSYMKNPNYQVDLESQFLTQVDNNRVLEVGRYFTGPVRQGTGGIYVILWEQTNEDNWKIRLDFNF